MSCACDIQDKAFPQERSCFPHRTGRAGSLLRLYHQLLEQSSLLGYASMPGRGWSPMSFPLANSHIPL
ncbi:rCG59274 [Rattus norvegicus]|uniref:RCG59274 n=1 Tax=Rattus norvegicus TaxID=10116 RepID=A6K7H3_RAT|nr:rCG59274 [Rattus norvegicus]